jgi:hypothetical protein
MSRVGALANAVGLWGLSVTATCNITTPRHWAPATNTPAPPPYRRVARPWLGQRGIAPTGNANDRKESAGQTLARQATATSTSCGGLHVAWDDRRAKAIRLLMDVRRAASRRIWLSRGASFSDLPVRSSCCRGQVARGNFHRLHEMHMRRHRISVAADPPGARVPGGLRFFPASSGAGDRVRSFRAILTSDVGALGIQRAVERRGASGQYRRIPAKKPPVMGAWWR